jgi:hypothetical protein
MELYLEETGTYYHQGQLPQLESRLLPLCRTDEFEKNTVYSAQLFEEHLAHVASVAYLDDLTSCVARCVEYGFEQQLRLLLSQLDRLVELSMSNDEVTILDYRLLLRKIDLPCYIIAQEAGFVDFEWEKRVILIQRLFRKQPIDGILGNYSGPEPEEYMGPSLDRLRYWGYRQMLYYVRWNRRQRYRMLKLIQQHWEGDCRYQAYVDFLESDTEHLLW